MSESRLIAAATDARAHASPRLTGFSVGAAALTAHGNIFTGSNAEIFAGQILHAEPFALGAARNAGEDVVALAVVADSDKPCTPCGQCCEWLRASMPPEAPVFVHNLRDHATTRLRVSDLLPNAPDLETDLDR